MVLQVDPDGAGSALDPLRPMLVDQINHFGSQRHGLLARRLLREIHEPDSLSRLAIESLGFEMLVQAARRGGPAIERSTPDWLDLAEEYVRAHFRESIRIADVAEAAGVHPSHLAGVFRERHGIPLGTFIRRLRLEWAADELLRSEDSIGSIAYAAGYCDQSHLTRAFGDYFGMTPGAYRRARGRA